MAPSRLKFICLPTPLHRLERMSEELGQEIWIKRDDLTGFGLGGNKGRKLEYLAKSILDSGATCVVGCGASQSNFTRQLAAVCSVFGWEFHAVCMDYPFIDEERRISGSKKQGGNQAVDELWEVHRHLIPDGTWDELEEKAEEIADELRKAGRKVFLLPLGGSTPEGVHAYVEAGRELERQSTEEFDWIFCASSSGSTHVGLATYCNPTKSKVCGISCDPEPESLDDLVALSVAYEEKYGGERPLSRREIDLRLGYVGEGYGVPSLAGEAAFTMMAKWEGILLDQVYTAKAFSGLMDMVKKGESTGKILFWHTGGIPSFFTY